MNVILKGEFITLGQILKAAGMVMSGGEAKDAITGGLVKVNGEIETRRGRKLYKGDEVFFEGQSCMVE